MYSMECIEPDDASNVNSMEYDCGMDEAAAARAELQGRALRDLLIVNQLVTTRLSRALHPTALSLTHVSFLSLLRRVPDGASVSQIAEAMEVNQPAVSKTLKALEELGAVTTARDADDARRLVVRMTSRGHELLGRAEQAMHPAATAIFRELSTPKLAALVGDLEALQATIERVE